MIWPSLQLFLRNSPYIHIEKTAGRENNSASHQKNLFIIPKSHLSCTLSPLRSSRLPLYGGYLKFMQGSIQPWGCCNHFEILRIYSSILPRNQFRYVKSYTLPPRSLHLLATSTKLRGLSFEIPGYLWLCYEKQISSPWRMQLNGSI